MSTQIEVERYRIVELPAPGRDVKGRYWIYANGGYGTKLGARIQRQLEYSRVDEIALATYQERDSQQMRKLSKVITPSRIPVIYPEGLGVNDFLEDSEGGVRATLERSWADRDLWLPLTDKLIDASRHRLELELVSPAAAIIPFSCGGQLLSTAYIAYRIAIEFPKAKRIGITAIPDDAKSAAEFLKFIENIARRDAGSAFPWQADERAEPLFHYLILTDNGIDPKMQDRLVPMTIASLASKVRAEQSGSESLLNVLELLRMHRVHPNETAYLTLEYLVDPIPVKIPRKPCWIGRTFFRRPILPVYTETPVLVSRADNMIGNLTTGHGIPAFDVTTEDSAMVMSVPSSDSSWTQVQAVESQVMERTKHRGTSVLGGIHGPYWGRYPLESTTGLNPAEPLAAILLQRIYNGRDTIKQAVLRRHPGMRVLLPSATLTLGLLPPAALASNGQAAVKVEK